MFQLCLNCFLFVCRLTEVIQYAEEMEIDIPKIWQYFGELMGPMVQGGSVPVNFLRKAAEPLKKNNKAGLLVAEVLHAASHREVQSSCNCVFSLRIFMPQSLLVHVMLTNQIYGLVMQLVMNTYIL